MCAIVLKLLAINCTLRPNFQSSYELQTKECILSYIISKVSFDHLDDHFQTGPGLIRILLWLANSQIFLRYIVSFLGNSNTAFTGILWWLLFRAFGMFGGIRWLRKVKVIEFLPRSTVEFFFDGEYMAFCREEVSWGVFIHMIVSVEELKYRKNIKPLTDYYTIFYYFKVFYSNLMMI